MFSQNMKNVFPKRLSIVNVLAIAIFVSVGTTLLAGDVAIAQNKPPDSLQQKMRSMQASLQEAIKEEKDLHDVSQLIANELKPNMEQGKFKEAEEVVDRVLELLEEVSKTDKTDEKQKETDGTKTTQNAGNERADRPPDSLQQKMKSMQTSIQEARKEGKDLSNVRQLIANELKPNMEQGKFKEAEDVVDQVLKLLK